MSQQGLRIKRLGFFGGYLSVPGTLQEFAYNLDFINKKKADDYFQFIRDAG